MFRYGGEHKAKDLQQEAVYGLTELHREEIKSARLVANPGCYPTSVQLPLVPLLKVGLRLVILFYHNFVHMIILIMPVDCSLT